MIFDILKKICRILQAAFLRFLKKEMPVYAANVVLYMELAIIPLLIVVLTFVHRLPFLNADQLILLVQQDFPDIPMLQNLLIDLIREIMAGGTTVLSAGSALIALFSAASGIAALINGMRKLYGFRRWNIVRVRLEAVVYTILFVFLISFGMSSALLLESAPAFIRTFSDAFQLDAAVMRLLQPLKFLRVIAMVLSFLVVLCFYTLPFHGKHTFRSQVPGAVFCMISWQIAGSAFAFYITKVAISSMVYGSLSAIVLLSLWFLVIIYILYMGGAINKVAADAKLPEPPKDEEY